MKDKILNQLLTLKYATIYNFYSPEAKTQKGSVLQASLDFARYEKAGYIKPIPRDEGNRPFWRDTFWQVTLKGARSIDREDEYVQKDMRAISNVKHESMKIDFAMSWLRHFGGEFEYRANIDGKCPDIVIKYNKHCNLTFFVEIERKRSPGRVVENMKRRWDDNKTPVLVIYAPIEFDPYMRPQSYDSALVAQAKDDLRRLVNRARGLNDRFRFIHFYQFPDINKGIWFRPDGHKVPLFSQ